MKENKISIFFWGIAICISIILLTDLNIKFCLAFLLLLIFTTIFIINIKFGIVLLLIVRSIMDLLSRKNIIPNLNIDASGLFTIYVTFLIIIYILINKIKIKNNYIISYFIIFINICILSSIIPNNYHLGITYIIKYLSILLIYFIIAYFSFKDLKYNQIILKGIILSSIVPLLFGLYQIIFKTGQKVNTLIETQQELSRIYGTFVHPNVFAFYLLIIIVASVLYLSNYQKNKCILIVLAFAILELYFTYSRGAWLGFLFIVILTLLLSDMILYKKLCFVLILSVLFIPIIDIMSVRFTNLFSNKLEESSLATRLYIWKDMYKIFGQKPLFGYGMNSFQNLSKEVLNFRIQAHSDYLKLLIETGVFGLVSYLVLQISILFARISSKEKNFKIVIILVITFLGMSLGDNINDMTVCQWYLWAIVALNTKGIFVKQENNNRINQVNC